MMVDEKIKGSQIITGINGAVSSASKSNNAQFALFSEPTELKRDTLNIVRAMLEN